MVMTVVLELNQASSLSYELDSQLLNILHNCLLTPATGIQPTVAAMNEYLKNKESFLISHTI